MESTSPQQPDPVIVPGRRRPHELMLLAVSVLLGVAFFAGSAPPPTTVEALLPDWVRDLWYGLLLGSGSVGLIAVWLRDIATGLLLERIALMVNAAALVIYITAIIAVGGRPGVGAGAFLAGWSIANIIRAVQITRDLHRIRRGPQ